VPDRPTGSCIKAAVSALFEVTTVHLREKQMRITTRTTRTIGALVAAAALSLGAVAVPASAGAATTCATGWGSLREQKTRSSNAELTNVRTGHHTCYDRLVVDLDPQPQPVPVQVPPRRHEVGDPADLRLEVLIGVGDHRSSSSPPPTTTPESPPTTHPAAAS